MKLKKIIRTNKYTQIIVKYSRVNWSIRICYFNFNLMKEGNNKEHTVIKYLHRQLSR